MSVKVTLEFESVDLAIVALDKLVGTVPLKRAEARASSAPAAVPATRTRKGRSDAGQARGPYKDTTGAGAGTVPTASSNGQAAVTDTGNAGTAATLPSTPAEQAPESAVVQSGAHPAPAVGGTPVVSNPAVKIELVQAAIQKLYDAKGMVPAREVLSRYGVNAVRDAKTEHYALIIADCERVTAGGAP